MKFKDYDSEIEQKQNEIKQLYDLRNKEELLKFILKNPKHPLEIHYHHNGNHFSRRITGCDLITLIQEIKK